MTINDKIREVYSIIGILTLFDEDYNVNTGYLIRSCITLLMTNKLYIGDGDSAMYTAILSRDNGTITLADALMELFPYKNKRNGCQIYLRGK